jgi:hypothetical protein
MNTRPCRFSLPCACAALAATALPAQCPDNAFYFGSTATTDTHIVEPGAQLVISMRNREPCPGFQLGVQQTDEAGGTRWSFSGSLGRFPDQLIHLVVVRPGGISAFPETPNQAASPRGVVTDVRRGAAIADFSARDFFLFELEPPVGGPGFFVAYLADAQRARDVIPATSDDPGCPLNEVLILTLGDRLEPGRQRPGDANQDGRLDIADAISILMALFAPPEQPGRPGFPCGDGLPNHFANFRLLRFREGGPERITLADAIGIINFCFFGGPRSPLGRDCIAIVGCPMSPGCAGGDG